MDDRRRRAEQIFHEVSELEGQAREDRLLELCRGDLELRAEVDSLLRHLGAVDDGFLDNALQLITHRRRPESIGPYRTLSLLGEGGMGSVYLAEQSEPLTRKVAVKVMAFGTHHATLTQRFLSERRTLARLTHPNIAQVFDAGATADGAPYFAMEYVEGPTLPGYCDEHRLELNQRIRLFLAVCAGVQHAHQRGIIHRDLKPSNVLVATHDGQPTPKIIDFGIAKDIDPEDDAAPTLTVGPIGTPDYMSPEQMGGEVIVDTRADVYSLGMLLYELFTGTLPHDPHTLRKMSLPQRLRHAADTDFPRPSQRLSGLDDAGAQASSRRTTPEALRRALRSDLDWIVLRALEKDPERRYSSAADLAADLRRSLDHQPVTARPPDRGYLFRKAVRRNPLAWAMGTAALVLLLGFLSVLVVQNRRIAREQARVAREATTAQRAVDFLVEMFRQADPRVSQVKTAREILEIGKERVTQLDDEPEVRARLLHTMGVAHMEMGQLTDGQSLLEQSIEVASGELDAPAQVSSSQDALATLLRQIGELERAEELQRLALETRLDLFGPDDVRVLSSQSNLGVILQTQGRLEEADALFRATSARWPPSEEPQRAIMVRNNIAAVAMEQRNFAEAESLLVEVVAQRTALLGARHLETLEARSNLALCYAETGRVEGAIALWQEVLSVEQEELGFGHPNTLRTATNLASAYRDTGDLDRADSILVDVLRSSRESLGNSGRGTLAALNNLGTLRLRQGRWAEAIQLFQEEVGHSRDVFGDESANTLRAQSNLAVSYRGAGQYAEAEEILLAVLAARTRQLGASHPDVLRTTSSLGLVHERQQQWAKAEVRHRAAYEGRRVALGPDNRSTLGSLRNLVRTLVQAGRRDEALELARSGKTDGLDIERLLADPLLAEVAELDPWQNLLTVDNPSN